MRLNHQAFSGFQTGVKREVAKGAKNRKDKKGFVMRGVNFRFRPLLGPYGSPPGL